MEAKAEAHPLDMHAQMFYMYMPRFRSQLNMMNKKALIRLIASLVEFPLSDKEIKLRSQLEQDAFNTGDQLLTSKYVMMIVTDAETQRKMEEEKKELDKSTESVVESNLESKGENTNG